jgi:hypothetical protein
MVFSVQTWLFHISGDPSAIVEPLLLLPVLPTVPLHHLDVLWALPGVHLAGEGAVEGRWITALWILNTAARAALLAAAWTSAGMLLPRLGAVPRALLVFALCLGASVPWVFAYPNIFNSGSTRSMPFRPTRWSRSPSSGWPPPAPACPGAPSGWCRPCRWHRSP